VYICCHRGEGEKKKESRGEEKKRRGIYALGVFSSLNERD
jgi:hypothetical protein